MLTLCLSLRIKDELDQAEIKIFLENLQNALEFCRKNNLENCIGILKKISEEYELFSQSAVGFTSCSAIPILNI